MSKVTTGFETSQKPLIKVSFIQQVFVCVCVCVNNVSGNVLSNGTIMVNKRVIIPTLMELAFSGENDSKQEEIIYFDECGEELSGNAMIDYNRECLFQRRCSGKFSLRRRCWSWNMKVEKKTAV